jgi:hypothetical protein
MPNLQFKNPVEEQILFLLRTSFQLFGFSSKIKPPQEYYEVNR